MLALYASAETGGVRLDVPFVAQPEDGCGAAAIVMLMQYWHREQPSAPGAPDVQELRPLISREARGIKASDVEQYLKQHGYRTFAVRGDWSDVEQNLLHGRPLLVALRSPSGTLHYVVLTGFDPAIATVVKNDPAQRKGMLQQKREFLEQWKGTGYWMLLAVPS